MGNLERDALLRGAQTLRAEANLMESLANTVGETVEPNKDVDILLTNIKTLPAGDFLYVLRSIKDQAATILTGPGYLTIREASKIKHISTTRIKDLAEQGILEGSTKLDNVWYIPRTSLDSHNFPGRGRTRIK